MPATSKESSGKSKNQSILGYWSSLGIQERLMFVMTIGLIVSSFFMGYFYGQLQTIKGGTVAKTNGVGSQDGAVGDQIAEAPIAPEITDELWNQLLADPAAAKGPEDAEVVLVEFTDYQCPFCQRHFEQTASLIEENYVSNNKIRYITRDLPLAFHGNANVAAQAARCAGDQNQYWQMHDKLFDTQQLWSAGDPLEKFSAYAGELGLNVGTFDSCLSSEKYRAAVDADAALASKVGASGTPSFFVNRTLIVGAQPYSAFETAIEAEL